MHAAREKHVAAGIALFMTLILLIGTATAANTPSHPLSQVRPTDTNLNFSSNPDGVPYNITGLGAISNFFAQACPGNTVIERVYPNGSYQCTTPVPADQWVDETGDTMSGNLDMDGNDIQNVGSLPLDWNNLQSYPSQCPAGHAVQSVGDSLTCAKLNTGGEINSTGANTSEVAFFIDNTTVTSDPNLYFDSATYELGIKTKTPQASLDVNGTVLFRNGLDVNDSPITNVGSIQNFFGANCGSNEIVKSVNDDGTYNCVQKTAVTDTWINESGDAMTGNLNMTGNNITDVRALTGFFDNACAGGNVVEQVYDNGTVVCTDPAKATENLSETLEAGNSAGNHDIDVNSNNIINVNALSVTQALTDGNLSDAITVGSSGVVNSSAVEDRIAGNQLTYTGGVLDVNDGAGSGLNADTLDGKDGNYYRQNLSQVLVEGNRANRSIAMAGNDITGIGALTGTGGEVTVNEDVNVTGSVYLSNAASQPKASFESGTNIIRWRAPDDTIVADLYHGGDVRLPNGGLTVGADQNPAAQLHVAGDALVNGQLNVSGNNVALEDGYISNDGDNEGVAVDDTGQVGIGTNSPSADLDVNGNASVSSSGTDMQVQNDGDVVITLGSG